MCIRINLKNQARRDLLEREREREVDQVAEVNTPGMHTQRLAQLDLEERGESLWQGHLDFQDYLEIM